MESVPHGAGLESGRNRQGPLHVFGEHGGHQSVLCAVGPVNHLRQALEAEYTLHGPEDLQEKRSGSVIKRGETPAFQG